MKSLHIQLLGAFHVRLDDEPVTAFDSDKARALLAYLAVEADHPHRREKLAGLFWPELPERRARANLSQVLFNLRDAIGDREADPPILRITPSAIQFNAKSDYRLDVAVFTTLLTESDSHPHQKIENCPVCLERFEQAAACYQGDFLAGFSLGDCPSFEEWIVFHQERFHRQVMEVLHYLGHGYAGQRAYKSALQYAQRAVELDPIWEVAQRDLMQLLVLNGQRSEALVQYETCRRRLADEMGIEPEKDTKALYQRIRDGDQAPQILQSEESLTKKSPPPHNLDTHSLTSFIGRQEELAAIANLIASYRLVTLTGAGGIGKTQLGLQVGRKLLDAFPDGVWLIELAPVADPALLPQTTADVLGLRESSDRPVLDKLLDFLQEKHALLILDNCEHLIEAAAHFVETLLQTCPELKIMVTSREALGVPGEMPFLVSPLSFPENDLVPSLEDWEQYEALRLFVERAATIFPGFQVKRENIPPLVQICQRLDGIPLALELAAARVKILTLEQIATRLDDRFRLLTVGSRTALPRQKTLQASIEWSWELLTEPEKVLLQCLSVFAGGMSLSAVETICAGDGIAEVDVLDLLTQLVNKSMLIVRREQGQETRYWLLETIRQYAAEKLEKDPVAEADTHSKHSHFYCGALAVWERALQGRQQEAALHEMVLEIDNIRAAWNWAVEKIQSKSLMTGINGLCIFLHRNRQRLEGKAVCKSLVNKLSVTVTPKLKQNSEDRVRKVQIDRLKLQARALAWGGYFNLGAGTGDRSHELIQKCLSTLERCELAEEDTRFEKAFAYLVLTLIRGDTRLHETKQLAIEGVRIFKSLGEFWWVGLALDSMGNLSQSTDGVSEAKSWYEESLAVHRKLGDLRSMGDRLTNLSWITACEFQLEKAEEMAYEALDIFTELGDLLKLVYIYSMLGEFLVWKGRFGEARSLYRETLAAYGDLEMTQSFAVTIHVHAANPDLYLGAYEAARNQAQHAVEVLREAKSSYADVWIALAIETLGGAALAEGSYAEAEGYFQECLIVFKAYEIQEKICQASACLGFIARAKKQIPQAQGYLHESLHVAIKLRYYVPLFYILPGIALLFADQGDSERAVELYALASTYGIVANSKWFADIAGDEFVAVAESLPLDVVEAANARGRSLDLWETADQLLGELEEFGWACADE